MGGPGTGELGRHFPKIPWPGELRAKGQRCPLPAQEILPGAAEAQGVPRASQQLQALPFPGFVTLGGDRGARRGSPPSPQPRPLWVLHRTGSCVDPRAQLGGG